MTGPQKYKLCTACGQSKSVDEFYRRKAGYLERWCKPCSIADVARRKAEKRRIARETRLALPVSTTKQCRHCSEVKPLSEYHQHGGGRLRNDCKPCSIQRTREWYANPENRARVSANGKSYAERHPERERVRRLARYGLTPDQYDSLYDAQSGRCLICGASQDRAGTGRAGGPDVLCVDHHHDTGAIRGLLCNPCNRGIGLLGDDPDRLTAAAEYLRGESNA